MENAGVGKADIILTKALKSHRRWSLTVRFHALCLLQLISFSPSVLLSDFMCMGRGWCVMQKPAFTKVRTLCTWWKEFYSCIWSLHTTLVQKAILVLFSCTVMCVRTSFMLQRLCKFRACHIDFSLSSVNSSTSEWTSPWQLFEIM